VRPGRRPDELNLFTFILQLGGCSCIAYGEAEESTLISRIHLFAPLLWKVRRKSMPDGQPSIGRQLLHYKIVHALGAGGMGIVYQAVDVRLGRNVALKFLPPQVARTDDLRRRFEVEAKAAAALDHVNVGTVYGVEETEDGLMFIVLAFYEGETLASKIARGPIRLAEAVSYARQIAQGLSAAHQKRILHRDIKPSNLVITNDGVVKIVDFGIARFDTEPRMTQTGESVGTPHYMSPEQALGKTADHRTDIWSLGVVLYEMSTGQRPFSGNSVHSVLYQIIHEPAPNLPSSVPRKLSEIVSRALSKDLTTRYSSARGMDQDLAQMQQLLQGAADDLPSTLTKSVTNWPALRLFWRRMARPAALCLALLLSLGIPFLPGVRERLHLKARDPKHETVLYESYLEGVKLLDRPGITGSLDKAIDLFQQCVKADPSFALAHAKLGEAYLLKYRTDQDASLLSKARESSNRALALNKEIPTVYVTLGSLDDGSGQHELAVQEFLRALQIDARNVGAYQGLGRAYDSLGRPREAEAKLQKAIDLSPQSWQGYSRLGAFYFAHNRLQESIEQYREVTKLAPENPLGYSNLGAVLLDAGQTKEATEMFHRSVQLSPSYSAFSNLGTSYYRAGNYSEAVRAYEKAMTFNDKDFNLLANLAICYRRLNGFDEKARAAYDRAQRATETYLQANSQDAEALGVLANLKAWLGQEKDAERLERQSLVLAPDNPDVELSAAAVLEHDHNRAEAIRLVASALKHGARRQSVRQDPDFEELVKDPRF
jgi:serine/threonine protein kinase/tetratricopeptide (TPR) repeat protein